MKTTILVFIATILLSFGSSAQNITFQMIQPPCKEDGILAASFTSIPLPATISWYYNGKYVTKTISSMATDTIYDFGGGSAFVYVYGTNGISYAGNFYSDLPFKIDLNTTINTCPNPSFAEVTVTGSSGPFTYEWYKNVNGNQILAGTSNPLPITTGEYGVVVTDNAGCYVSTLNNKQDSNALYVTVPVGFSYDIAKTEANCTDGTASVTNISAGSSPFTFQWSNGATTQNIQNLSAGNYQLTITDGDGCSAVEYEIYINQSIAIEVPATPSPAQCSNNDGSAIAFGSGGTPPYTYKWSNGANTQSITNLSGGYYSVEATDANGCKGTGYAYIGINSPVFVSILSSKPSSCTAPTGSAELSISGGTPPYSITWNTFPVQNGGVLTDVPPGNYSFTVMDNAGCLRTGNVVINPVSVINSNIKMKPANCLTPTGSLESSPTGGIPPYAYQWSTGSNTNSIANLVSGYYLVTISDFVGCSIVKSTYVAKDSPLAVGFNSTDASCIFANDGSITANAYNGTPPYNYVWNNGQQTSVISGLKQGIYSVAVTDANGCEILKNVTLGYNPNEDNCYCVIKGIVYNDINENCIQDSGEPGIINVQMYCKGVGYTYTNSNGEYSFIVPTGTFEISESIKTYSPLSACQNNKIILNTVSGSNCIHQVNFANKLNPIQDVHISLWNDNFAVPGFSYSQNLIITNSGTIAENNIISSYKTDNQIGVPTFNPDFLTKLIAPGHYNNGPLLALSPGGSEKVKVDYLIPANIPLNTSLYFNDSTHYQAPMSGWVNDYTPWNNVNQLYTNVIGSYDPNFIQVYPQGLTDKGFIGIKDSVLEYMVHFQNYGNYFATNVRVEVEIDENLDFRSIQPVFSSAKGSVFIEEKGKLIYYFDGINLYPKSWNEELSKGFFTFTIKQKPGLKAGTEIKNLADIFFDFNEAVRTNSTLNTIEKGADISPEPSGGIIQQLYPNPTSSTFNLRLTRDVTGPVEVKVYDLCGRLVKSDKVNIKLNSEANIDVRNLSNGTYFVNLVSEKGNSSTHKLIVIKD